MVFEVFLAFETRLKLFTSLCARLLVEQDGKSKTVHSGRFFYSVDNIFLSTLFLAGGEEIFLNFFRVSGDYRDKLSPCDLNFRENFPSNSVVSEKLENLF